MSADLWYYRHDGKPHGPFTPAQFEKLIRGRTVTPDTEVSLDGQVWKPLRDIFPPAPEATSDAPPDWMTAPTLLPGDINLPPDWKSKKPPT